MGVLWLSLESANDMTREHLDKLAPRSVFPEPCVSDILLIPHERAQLDRQDQRLVCSTSWFSGGLLTPHKGSFWTSWSYGSYTRTLTYSGLLTAKKGVSGQVGATVGALYFSLPRIAH